MALLPFVDEKRLLAALSQVYPDLTELESKFVEVNGYIHGLVLYICSVSRHKRAWETEYQAFGARIVGIV